MGVYTLSSRGCALIVMKSSDMSESYTHAAFEAEALQWLSNADEANRLHVPIPCACFNVRKASRAISQLYDEALQPAGLRGTQYSLLTAISYVGLEGVGVLSEVLVTDRTTLSRNLRPLVERGWVESVRDDDGRKRAYRLTVGGRAKLDAAIPLWERAQKRVADGLGEETFEKLRLLADDIVALAHGVK